MNNKLLFVLTILWCISISLSSEIEIENNNQKKFIHQQTFTAPIGISYRSDGEGKGSFYDHYTVQKSTNHQTCIVKSPNMKSVFHKFANEQTFNIPFGIDNIEIQKKIPPIIDGFDEEVGLLFIPGRVRNLEDKERDIFELNIIRQAILKGRPILAVCAGSWRLWEAYGGKTKEVKDHNYNGGMVRLNDIGIITHNIQIHNVMVKPMTLLSSIMGEVVTPVNSVHWLAPDDNLKIDEPLYSLLDVSGRSVKNKEISINTRQGLEMNPEEETVEAFETSSGSPVIGIQWHPEAYCSYMKGKKIYSEKSQKNILLFMAKAGDSYSARRRMMAEFKKKFQPLATRQVAPLATRQVAPLATRQVAPLATRELFVKVGDDG